MSTSFSLNKKVAFKKKKKVLNTSALGFGDDQDDSNADADPVASKKEEVRRANEQIAAQANAAMRRTLGLQAEALKQDPNIFNYDNADNADNADNNDKKPARTINMMPHMRRALKEEDAIIEEDNDEEEYRFGLIQMKDGSAKKGNATSADSNTKEAPKKSQYIETLMQVAKRRGMEQDIIKERQLVREREKDDEMYGDKPKFVTSAYKKVLEERQALREEHEKIEDNTGLNSFYKGLLDRKEKEGKKGRGEKAKSTSVDNNDGGDGGDGGDCGDDKTEGDESGIPLVPDEQSSATNNAASDTQNDDGDTSTTATAKAEEIHIPSPKGQHKTLLERIGLARAAYWVRRKYVTATSNE